MIDQVIISFSIFSFLTIYVPKLVLDGSIVMAVFDNLFTICYKKED